MCVICHRHQRRRPHLRRLVDRCARVCVRLRLLTSQSNKVCIAIKHVCDVRGHQTAVEMFAEVKLMSATTLCVREALATTLTYQSILL